MNERDRVLKIMQSEGMNAKQFCQEVGISQGTLSNIMGGRNKPSLDVMQAILRRFRAINCDWLIMGIGNMYLSSGLENSQPELFGNEESAEDVESSDAIALCNTKPVLETLQGARTVEKVLIFYSDGTFEER